MAKFFISYTGVNTDWAQWIAWTLREAGHGVELQAWDFAIGDNFVAKIDAALRTCDRVVQVLSPEYLASPWCREEWTNALAAAVKKTKGELLPVKVVACDPDGLLTARAYLDISTLDSAKGKEALLLAANGPSGVPKTAPVHPNDAAKAAQMNAPVAPRHPNAPPPIWTVPHTRNRFLRGREEALATLHDRLKTEVVSAITQPQVAHGLGGVGKTQLAVEYAYRFHLDFNAVLWVGADNPSTADSNLAKLAAVGALELPERNEREQPVQVQAVKDWLKTHTGWLLVLDSADSAEAHAWVNAFLQEYPWHGRILVTSRRSDWGEEVEPVSVGKLSTADAAAFLQARTGLEAEGQAAEGIAKHLDGFPLALEQAAAYVKTYRIALAAYLKRLDANRAKVLAEHTQGFTHYPRALAETWLLTEQELSLPARALLRLCAFLAPDDIPRWLFTEDGPHLAEATTALAKELKHKGKVAHKSAEDALVELSKHGMIELAQENFSVHRLVLAVQVERIAPGARKAWVERTLAVVDDAATGDPRDVRTWLRWVAIEDHILAVTAEGDKIGVAEPTAGLMNQLAVFLLCKAQFRKAEPLMRSALAIGEAAFAPEHPTVAVRLSNLASLLHATNRLTEAEPLKRRALAIDEAAFGPNHPEVATDLNNLAQLLAAKNRLTEAEPLIRRALAIDEAALGLKHPNVAIRLNNLAQLLQDTNRLAEAEPLMRRTLAISEAAFGSAHPTVATGLNNLALLLQATNRLAEAESLLRRVLAIDEAAYGPDYPDVARDLNNLALLLQATNRFVEAEPLMRRAVQILRHVHAANGHPHPKADVFLTNYRAILTALNLPPTEITARLQSAAGDLYVPDPSPADPQRNK